MHTQKDGVIFKHICEPGQINQSKLQWGKKLLQIIYFGYGANNNTSQRSITNEGIFSQVFRTRSSSFTLPEEMPRHFLT